MKVLQRLSDTRHVWYDPIRNEIQDFSYTGNVFMHEVAKLYPHFTYIGVL